MKFRRRTLISSRRVLIAAAILALLPVFECVSAQEPAILSFPDESAWKQSIQTGYSLDSRPGEEDALCDDDLIGYWEHRDAHGTVSLEIVSEDCLWIGERKLKYCVIPGAIRLTDDCGEFDYPYQLVDNLLILTLSDDREHPLDVVFQRVTLSGLPALPASMASYLTPRHNSN